MKKRTILLALLFAATGLSPLQAQKKYKAYIVSNSHLDTQWNWDVQTLTNTSSIHWSETSICFSIIPIMYLTLKAEWNTTGWKSITRLSMNWWKNISKKVVGISQVALGMPMILTYLHPNLSSAIFCWDNNSINKSLELNLQISSCRTVLDSVIHCPLLQHIVA